MIDIAIKKAFDSMVERQWDTIYFAIDLHDTIIKGTYSKDNVFEVFSDCLETLNFLTEIKYVKLILFTSSFGDYVFDFLNWISQHGITFDYFNENPECQNTASGDFSSKFYYNVLIDDKAGFVPETDWTIVKNTVAEKVFKEDFCKKFKTFCACINCYPEGFCVEDPCLVCEGPIKEKCDPPEELI